MDIKKWLGVVFCDFLSWQFFAAAEVCSGSGLCHADGLGLITQFDEQLGHTTTKHQQRV